MNDELVNLCRCKNKKFEDHTQLRQLQGYLCPLGVPLFDDGHLLVGQLGNLGDVRHELHEIWIEGVGFVGKSDEQQPETCIVSAYTYAVLCQHQEQMEWKDKVLYLVFMKCIHVRSGGYHCVELTEHVHSMIISLLLCTFS